MGRGDLLTAGSGSEREVSKDDDKNDEKHSPHPHHPRMRHMTRTLRLDARDSSNRGYQHGKAQPDDPAHTRGRYKSRATSPGTPPGDSATLGHVENIDGLVRE